MAGLIAAIAGALWLLIGTVTAVHDWRSGRLDYSGDEMFTYRQGVVDKAMWAVVIAMLGPCFPISACLERLNQRTGGGGWLD